MIGHHILVAGRDALVLIVVVNRTTGYTSSVNRVEEVFAGVTSRDADAFADNSPLVGRTLQQTEVQI